MYVPTSVPGGGRARSPCSINRKWVSKRPRAAAASFLLVVFRHRNGFVPENRKRMLKSPPLDSSQAMGHLAELFGGRPAIQVQRKPNAARPVPANSTRRKKIGTCDCRKCLFLRDFSLSVGSCGGRI